jgi:hypothetical protein
MGFNSGFKGLKNLGSAKKPEVCRKKGKIMREMLFAINWPIFERSVNFRRMRFT